MPASIFGKGVNAILELARQIEKVSGFTDLKKGLTVNVGIVRGGSRTNVVPPKLRHKSMSASARRKMPGIDKKMRSLRAFNSKCKLEISGGINRLSHGANPRSRRALQPGAGIARQIGWKLGEAAVGGGSDGNFTAGMGIPTLDGLGGVGDGAHAVHEFIVTSELPRRALLLAGMIESV